MLRKKKEKRESTEYMPLFEEPTDRDLFRRLVVLGILNEEKERKNWFSDVPRGEDGLRIMNFKKFLASNRAWYLWLLSLHDDGHSPEEIRRKSAEKARENIRSLREYLRRKASLS
ncbi:hypothetical protein A3H22_02560 [Candidatus Peribacteria bacterium RIFCSPLOWO2_12_FULL_55_15]|nr:MAG: hypothetical protein A2789_02975 [Candidatus Peribacteria bacterium RIFCSPHIGHO2_01_FULL_54_22]OGJ62913.1 MAG: hypothetical protein A3D12_01210 [Candidatus Peribacteria bacterium RIFCSPHIGHO2_02_FULL_55_24]OGJ65109.1 MAG: hypothetical protein A3E47_02140 [Candidatus Peribacteria bacterium RIFCSPHIGHO2_12_FULL_54_10]OGJ67299.1 MAG: hypothetical protein A2947_01220 [Candidatus Peribacteria bacterium RIFCSPLOWO2_01_FULL_54_110]OGJ70031.1 MAG: hypothetical protein A3H90_03725 [Candidatus Pe